MKRRPGSLLLCLGSLLLAGALGLTAYNLRDARRAAEAAGEAARAVLAEILTNPADPAPPWQPHTPAGEDPGLPPLPTVTVADSPYLGLLEIPDMELSLPVRADWDFEALRDSPCRFSGSWGAGDLVICAHNYPGHFGGLWDLPMGAELRLITADGWTLRYLVANRELLEPTEVSRMVTADPAAWDLTLFTCTLGGQTRWALRCLRLDDE